MIRNKRESRSSKSKDTKKVNVNEQKLTMFFKKSPQAMQEANKPLIPEKQRNMTKIK